MRASDLPPGTDLETARNTKLVLVVLRESLEVSRLCAFLALSTLLIANLLNQKNLHITCIRSIYGLKQPAKLYLFAIAAEWQFLLGTSMHRSKLALTALLLSLLHRTLRRSSAKALAPY